ncbi:hypothetical protein IWW38_004438, partial [Coemansia aciculifera]
MGPSSVTPRVQPFAFSPRGQIPGSIRPLKLTKSTAQGSLAQQLYAQPQHIARAVAGRGRHSASPEPVNACLPIRNAIKPAAYH